jgi:tRNA isopentenyl-2-thiomethyl-A-37 hydroxylase MiaE
MSQLAQLLHSAERIEAAAIEARRLAKAASYASNTDEAARLIEKATVELSIIHRHTERSMQLCTDMNSAIRASEAL